MSPKMAWDLKFQKRVAALENCGEFSKIVKLAFSGMFDCSRVSGCIRKGQ